MLIMICQDATLLSLSLCFYVPLRLCGGKALLCNAMAWNGSCVMGDDEAQAVAAVIAGMSTLAEPMAIPVIE